MGGRSLRRRPTVRAVAVAALTCGLLGGLVASPAAADKSDVDRVTGQIAALQMESAKAGEKANGARVALSRSLDRLGLFRRQATRARIELARQQLPDLIILDLMMPEVDGFSVLDSLKTDPSTDSIPVIVVTAKELTSDEKTRLQGRIHSLMEKGTFMSDELLDEVTALLR